MKNLSHDELAELIWDKVKTLYDKVNEDVGSTAVLPTSVAQISVYATLQVLEELGLLTLPERSKN